MDLPNILFWNWSPVLWLIGGMLLGWHLHITKYKVTGKTILFAAGLVLVEIALALPMGPAQQPLFSLHMIRHIILLMMAPPLLVAGLPEKFVRHLFSVSGIRKKTASFLLNPFLAWVLGVGIMWFWHTPAIFNAMVSDSNSTLAYLILHTAEIVSLLGIGLLFCSPILFPMKEYRLPPLKGVVYLFTACWGCSILGILITFASPGLYHTVFSGSGTTVWGLTQTTDQQAGGLLMWVPGCFIYLSGVMILLVRWFSVHRPVSQSTKKQSATST